MIVENQLKLTDELYNNYVEQLGAPPSITSQRKKRAFTDI